MGINWILSIICVLLAFMAVLLFIFDKQIKLIMALIFFNKDKYFTPIHDLVGSRKIFWTELLIKRGYDINKKGGMFEINNHKTIWDITPLLKAVALGDIAHIKLFIKYNVDINAASEKITPLRHAVSKNNLEIVRLLIESGANVNLQDYYKRSPISDAIKNENIEMVRLLVSLGADVNMQHDEKCTPIHIAISEKSIDIVEYLLQNGASIFLKDYKEKNALIYALEIDIVFVKTIINHDKKILDEPYQHSLLYYAIQEGNLEIINYLENVGVKIDFTLDRKGTTILHGAMKAKTNRLKIIEKLLAAGQKANIRNDHGSTPLHCLQSSYHVDTIVDMLLGYGADLNVKNNSGLTPLHTTLFSLCEDEYVSSWSSPNAFAVLLKKGCDINAQDNNGNTVLHRAAIGHSKRVIWFLLDNGADKSIQNNDGQTPLQYVLRSFTRRSNEALQILA